MLATESLLCDVLGASNDLPDNENLVDASTTTGTHVGSTGGSGFDYTQDQSAAGFSTQPGGTNAKVGSQSIRLYAAHSDDIANLSSQATGNLFVKMLGTGSSAWVDLGAVSLNTNGSITTNTFSFLAEDYPGYTGIDEVGVTCAQGGGSPSGRGFIKLYAYEVTAQYDQPIPFNVQVWDDAQQAWVNGRFVGWDRFRCRWVTCPLYHYTGGSWNILA